MKTLKELKAMTVNELATLLNDSYKEVKRAEAVKNKAIEKAKESLEKLGEEGNEFKLADLYLIANEEGVSFPKSLKVDTENWIVSKAKKGGSKGGGTLRFTDLHKQVVEAMMSFYDVEIDKETGEPVLDEEGNEIRIYKPMTKQDLVKATKREHRLLLGTLKSLRDDRRPLHQRVIYKAFFDEDMKAVYTYELGSYEVPEDEDTKEESNGSEVSEEVVNEEVTSEVVETETVN